MPRHSKGPRLYFRPASAGRAAGWIILDGPRQRGTGLGVGASEEAKSAALRKYLTAKHTASVTGVSRNPDFILTDDVLTLYTSKIVPKHARPWETAARIDNLRKFFGSGKRLSYVTGDTCEAYAAARGGGARRELEDLRSAINYHRKRGLHDKLVSVLLPEKAQPRERWLTRGEAAHLILTAWRYRTTFGGGEFEGINKAGSYRYAWRHGPRIYAEFGTPEFKAEFERLTAERPKFDFPRRHVARFMLVARYMGSRASVICGASIEPKRPAGRTAWIDLTTGLFYGRGVDERATKKRKQLTRIPPPLLAHLRRWRRSGQRFAVEWRGKPVTRVSKGHNAAVAAAGLGPDVTPHTWRHTVATWLMQAGADPWKAAGFLAMSVETLTRNYGHHHPDHSADVHAAIRNQKKQARAGQ